MQVPRYPTARDLTNQFVDDDNLQQAINGVIDFFQTKNRANFLERTSIFDYYGIPRTKLNDLRLALNRRFSIDLTVGEAQNFVTVRDIQNAVRRDLYVSLNGKAPTPAWFDTSKYSDALPIIELPFSYAQIEQGWTMTRFDTNNNGQPILQLNNNTDMSGTSHFYATVVGTDMAAKMNIFFKDTEADKTNNPILEAKVDDGNWFTAARNSATDDYQVFSGLSDGPHRVELRTPEASYQLAHLRKNDSQFRVSGSVPALVHVDQWLQPGIDNPNLYTAGGLAGGFVQPTGALPDKINDYISGSAAPMSFRANVREIVVLTNQRAVHLFDGTTMMVVDTVATGGYGGSKIRAARFTGLSGLKTYNVWLGDNGLLTTVSVGLIGGVAQTRTIPERVLHQFGDSITASIGAPQERGYRDVFRVAANRGYVGNATGQGGASVADLANTYLDQWLAPLPAATSIDAAILAIGQNGGVPSTADYNKCLDKIKAKGFGRIVCRGIFSGGDAVTINNIIANLVTNRNDPTIKYLDTTGWVVNRPDGIHPDVLGYDQIVALETPAIQPLLA